MNKVIKICGLDCANCARELEEELEKIEGVVSVSVDFMAQKVYADCDGVALEKIKHCCNHFEDVKVVEENPYGKTIKIEGLCCANCGRELEEDLNKIEGITATVDFINSKIMLSAASPEGREKAIYTITHFEDVKIADGAPQKRSVWAEHLKDIISILISVALFVPALVLDYALPSLNKWYGVYELYIAAFIAAGYGVLINTAKNILKGKIFDENFLMTVAALGAIALGVTTGDGLFEGVAVMLLYQIGELLQGIAVGSSRNSISDLMDLKSESATVVKDGVQYTVAPDALKVDDIIIIKAGEKVPTDCVIVKGESSLDMKSLNGEPLPRAVREGDSILSGSINLEGVIEARVLCEYKNSAVAKILELVENSTAKKSKPEKSITKFAKYYTPAVCAAAAVVAAVVPTIICAVNGVFGWVTYSQWIYKALGFLVISCPCALVISVPLSYFGGIGRCAKSGILVKGSTCLDELALAQIAAFDKTGTITEGTFAVKSYTDGRTLRLAASAEKYSSHPIAVAFKGIEGGIEISDVQEIAGRGIKCTAEGQTLLCGNGKLLEEAGISFEAVESSSTLIYVAHGGKFVGVIHIDDKVKNGAKEAIEALKKGGIVRTVMLTGDSADRACNVAKVAGLDEFKAALLPDEKLENAQQMRKDGKLLYVGDGINDAPVMTAADCAVSMGKVGSDAAIEASDIVLVSDNIALLPKGRRIAKGTRRIVKQNIVGSLIVKAAIMALDIAIPGFPLIVSVVADVGVMLVAVLNAMRTALIK